MPRKNGPPTPVSPGSASDPDTSTSTSGSDFVILPRQSLEHGNRLQSLQLQPGSSSGSSSNNMTSVMQYDQLVASARSMKEENSMLREQLTDMMQMMGARTEEFLQMKSCNKQVAERCKHIRTKASEEMSRLRERIRTLEDQHKESPPQEAEQQRLVALNRTMIEKISCLEAKVRELETELKEKTEEVVVSYQSVESAGASDPQSLLTRLKREISEVQGTRADIRSNVAALETALQHSAVELRQIQQRAEHLRLEKQDLVALNNELQTKLSMQSLGSSDVGLTFAKEGEGGKEEEEEEMAGDEEATVVGGMERSGRGDLKKAGAARQAGPAGHVSHRPAGAQQAGLKSAVALQDVLLQLQAERDKVAGLMEELKRERRERDEAEKALTEQLSAFSGEHNSTVEKLNAKHGEQVEELMRKLNELTVANQEPHHSMELKLQVRSLVCELQERESILQQTEHSAMDLRAFNEALKGKLALYHDELEEVRRQDSQMIDMLREELLRQQNNLELEKQQALMERIKHEKVTKEYNQLFTDFDNLNREFEEHRTRSGQAVNAASLRELADQRDNLTAQLISAEEAMGATEAQLQKALTDEKEAQAKLETIPVLEAQAEIFKNDFDAERAAREKAHTEQEKLQLELHLLREDNQRLQDELSGHAQAQLQQMQQRHGSTVAGGGGGRSGSPAGPGAGLYERYLAPIFRPPRSESTAHPGRYGQGTVEAFTDVVGADVDEAGTGVIPPSTIQGGHAETPITNPRCPKCQEVFPDIDTLQIHMLDCIK